MVVSLEMTPKTNKETGEGDGEGQRSGGRRRCGGVEGEMEVDVDEFLGGADEGDGDGGANHVAD